MIVLLAGRVGAEEPFEVEAAPNAPVAASVATPAELGEIVIQGRKALNDLELRSSTLDQARDQILLPKIGATEYQIDAGDLDALPLGGDTLFDKAILQAPGVSSDSALSFPDFHIRNEYANQQYRINGIQLPDGVGALGSVLDTGFIESLSLLDGTLPAQYGLRTAGVIDIKTKTDATALGSLGLYGGSVGTISPHLDYAGVTAETQYFFSARYLSSREGLENATSAQNPIHDQTSQGRFFGYVSTMLGESSRMIYMSGAFVGHYQIPDLVGQVPLGDFGPDNLQSTRLNENETDRFFFATLAFQTHRGETDAQVALFTRYASSQFLPDLFDDLAFNDVASRVLRKSLLGGAQIDVSSRISSSQILRGGLYLTQEHSDVDDTSTVLPVNAAGTTTNDPRTIRDSTTKTGFGTSAYVQDEWTLSPGIIFNMGARFDAANQFVNAHQFSPRLVLAYQPFSDTSLHVGVSRYFTPPVQVESTPVDLAAFMHTVQAPSIQADDAVRPERATYYDAGWDQALPLDLHAGFDLYYKKTTDALDDGEFGQAVVLDELNYAQGFSRGAEFKVKYARDGLTAYLNFSGETTMVKGVATDQYLIANPIELAYLDHHYTYAPDAQTLTASTGAAYRWRDTLITLNGFYGSGLRAGFANEQHSPGYAQWNGALAHEFRAGAGDKPLTMRLTVVNLFDRSYLLRAATGVGEFAPQYGPRRGVFVQISQAL